VLFLIFDLLSVYFVHFSNFEVSFFTLRLVFCCLLHFVGIQGWLRAKDVREISFMAALLFFQRIAYYVCS